MLFYILNWILTSFLNGLVFFFLFTFIFYWFYIKKMPIKSDEFKTQYEEFHLTDSLKKMIDKNKESLNGETNCEIALNMLLQFLFQELKDAKAVRRYIIRKMSLEFKELLSAKAAGKFIERLSARDFSLGTSFPILNSIKILSYQMDSTNKIIDEMNILIDFEYKNGFSISIDADLILGKSAYTHVKIALIKGKARLQFSRDPFTHWNFAFIQEPEMEFEASSQFDGREIPQLTTLILNQLRRSIRRKHTLPNYKLRFKPFFEQVYDQRLYKENLDKLLKEKELLLNKQNETNNLNNQKINSDKSDQSNESIQYKKLCTKLGFDLTSVGQLIVNLKVCDRLPEALYSLNLNQTTLSSKDSVVNLNQQQNQTQNVTTADLIKQDQCQIYLTTSLDNISMESLMEKRLCKDNWPMIEFEIQKTNLNQTIGINFTECFFVNRTEVCIQKIFPSSAIISSTVKNAKIFDIVYSLNQTRITSHKQLMKLIQKYALQPLKFVVQRPCIMMTNNVLTSANQLTKLNSLNLNNNNNDEEQTNDLINGSNLNINTPVNEAIKTSTSSTVTHTASASFLVDYFCSVSECLTSEQLINLDLISLLLNCDQVQEQLQQQQQQQTQINNMDNEQVNRQYFKKSRLIKLEKENLFALKRQPIQIDETYKFNLNTNTKYLNIFLWTVQYMNKSSKKKNLLIGYISVPLKEVNVDCWNTTKGETQSTLYFRPIDDLKASAISKLARSHVISDNIGFDSKISLGNLTLNIQHVLNTVNHQANDNDNNNNNNNNENMKKIKKDINATIVEDMIENNDLEVEMSKTSDEALKTDMNTNSDPLSTDDTSLHKFLNVQFNQTVICEICNKKIWFKSAYQCAYCGFIIHMKCYERAINKTICARFLNKSTSSSSQLQNENELDGETNENLSKKQDDSFVEINQNDINLIRTISVNTTSSSIEGDKESKKVKKRNSSPSSSSESSINYNKGIVSSFISGLRQRKTNNINSNLNDTQTNSTQAQTNNTTTPTPTSTSTSSTTFSKASLFLGSVKNKIKKTNNNNNNANHSDNLTSVKYSSQQQTNQIIVENNLDESLTHECDEFKDLDPNEDKLFGMELFEELSLDERKLKFEELIQKYQNTIDMMAKLKYDLELELDSIQKSKTTSKKLNLILQQEEQIKSQIKHLDDQVRCVLFLLMQCQIGLENCNENIAKVESKKEEQVDSEPVVSKPVELVENTESCLIVNSDENKPESNTSGDDLNTDNKNVDIDLKK